MECSLKVTQRGALLQNSATKLEFQTHQFLSYWLILRSKALSWDGLRHQTGQLTLMDLKSVITFLDPNFMSTRLQAPQLQRWTEMTFLVRIILIAYTILANTTISWMMQHKWYMGNVILENIILNVTKKRRQDHTEHWKDASAVPMTKGYMTTTSGVKSEERQQTWVSG